MAKASVPEHFDVHASVVYQLGEELITDTTQALVELVKNSYDADATYCKVSIITGSQPPVETEFPDSNGWIVVEDDGTGIRKQFKDGNLFVTRKGTPVHIATLNAQFRVIRRNANVVRLDGIRFQPRLHDLRSTFAVHRIAAWYEQGLDAQELLPALGAYLGQLGLISMNRHLSLTPEHYRKHLATASRRRDSRNCGSQANPLVAEFLKRIQNS